MRLVCPQCGLKGTADESLLEQNVKCPGCETVFRLTGPAQVTGDATNEGVSGVQDGDGSGQEVATGKCESCGFRLSKNYLTEIDTKLYCRVCVAAQVQTGAA